MNLEPDSQRKEMAQIKPEMKEDKLQHIPQNHKGL